jgi:hypothetical protein
MMNRIPDEEGRDPAWQLLRSARRVALRETFVCEVVVLTRVERQDLKEQHGRAGNVLQILRFAPRSWQAAAAAVLVFGLTVAGVSIFKSEPLGSPVAEGQLTENKVDVELAPFEDAFAIEEIDMLLSIEDPDALEEEDLLLLLLSDPELL